jgi:glyoxylase-like metal-dependent hydrolase (beta-lactamase superfamily II)
MAFQETDFNVISDGTFSLDPGAAFGITPRNIWSKEFTTNENYRIKLSANVTVIENNDHFYLLDSGIGSNPNSYLRKWFEAEPKKDLNNFIKRKNITKIDGIFQSHLHFDHMGRSFSEFAGTPTYASSIEIDNFKNPNDLSKSNYTYGDKDLDTSGLMPQFSTTKIGNFQLILSGGHTTGHQIILFESGNTRLMYLGDLCPTTFHIKPTRLTAIDSEPLKSLNVKKEYIKKAINEDYTLILSHDTKVSAVELKGDVDDPRWEVIQEL